jgi:dihydrofolate reductase
VIGGSQIYKLFLSKCQKVYHTLVKGNYQCDVFWSMEGEWESISVEETSEADYRELVRIIR